MPNIAPLLALIPALTFWLAAAARPLPGVGLRTIRRRFTGRQS